MDHRYKMVSLCYVLCFNGFFFRRVIDTFFPETVMQIGGFYDLHHGKIFITVSSENDKELWELNTGLPDKEEIFKYEVLSSVKPTTFFKIIYVHYYWTVLLDD